MSITAGVCNSFRSELAQGIHNLASDTIKVALYTSAASLDPTATVYTSSHEVSGTGYTAGGVSVGHGTVSGTGGTITVTLADPTWTSGSFTARGALVYNSSKSNRAIAVFDFGQDLVVSGNLQLAWNPPFLSLS